MDLLSRLIAGSAATSPTKQKLNTPAERLSACKRVCNSLQQTWRNGTRLTNDDASSTHVANLLNRLNTILHDESRKAAPYSCLLYTTSAQTYIIVAKLALSTDNAAVVNAARYFFHILINGEAEGVLDSKIFARSLIDLVRRSTLTATIIVDEKGEADLVELLFEIATKIRLDPDILPAWFYPERDQSRSQVQGAEARRSQFPLFYLLVEYVHHDGPIGDFARTGLLYLTDMASRSRPLEKWMIESDLAPQMASGLSALYSRLSRQAHVLTRDEKALPIIALSDIASFEIQLDDTPEEFDKNIKSFLSYLAFWQDTLNHCKSEEVRDTLLDHFQVLFVQQLLYPSLLESSDVAGGSTSAVILHLYRMLEALEHPDMARRMLQYLLAASKRKSDSSQPGHKRGRVSISRRKSMEQLASLAELANSPSPALFNLLDLLVISLHSQNSQTTNASLKLVTVMLRRHHRHVLTHLFQTRPLADSELMQSVSEFNRTMTGLFDLSAGIALIDSLDESYQAALSDGQLLLQRHGCMLYRTEMITNQEHPVHPYGVSLHCKLFEAIMDALRTFFANDSITNITLTETIIALASCEHVLLREWVTGGSNIDDKQSGLTLMAIFQELVGQLNLWKSRFTEWDALFSYQRTKLASLEDESDQGNVRSLSRTSNSSAIPRTSSPQPRPQRPSTPIRTSTGRVKKVPPAGFASIDGTLAQSPKLMPTSPSVKALAGSPLHQTSFAGDVAETATATTASTAPSNTSLAQLSQQIELPSGAGEEAVGAAFPQLTEQLRLNSEGSGINNIKISEQGSGTVTPSMQSEESTRTTASLSHIMTNAIILQEFILEIAALLQIRATLFDEVDLT